MSPPTFDAHTNLAEPTGVLTRLRGESCACGGTPNPNPVRTLLLEEEESKLRAGVKALLTLGLLLLHHMTRVPVQQLTRVHELTQDKGGENLGRKEDMNGDMNDNRK